MRQVLLSGILTLIAVLMMAPPQAVAQEQADDLAAIRQDIGRHKQAGRYGEAAAAAERALTLSEQRFGRGDIRTSVDLDSLGQIYDTLGRYPQAEDMLKRALASREKALGTDHVQTAITLNNLAEFYRKQARHAEAEPLYKRSMAILEKQFGPDAAPVATAAGNLGALYYAQGRYPQAEPLFVRALAIREKLDGPEAGSVGSALNNIGALYKAMARHADAEKAFRRSLAIETKTLGPDHPGLAPVLGHLAALEDLRGRAAEAEPLYRRALAVTERAFGGEHPETATRLSNLGYFLSGPGRVAEAETVYRRALAIRTRTLRADHPDIGNSLNNLAEILTQQGRYAEAEPHYKRTLAIFEKALGPGHENVATVLNNLARLYETLSRTVEAEALYTRALAIAEGASGRDNPEICPVLNNLARVAFDKNDMARAQALSDRCMAIVGKALGASSPELVTPLSQLSDIARRARRYAEAEKHLKRALAITQSSSAPNAGRIANLRNSLALLYAQQQRYKEAEALYKTALDERIETMGRDHPDVGTALSNLALLYFEQGAWTQSTAYAQRSADVLIRRIKRGVEGDAAADAGRQTEREASTLQMLVKAAWRAGQTQGSNLSRLFEIAEWQQGSAAAASLAQMAVRHARGDAAMAALVRERQDLAGEWRVKDKALIAALAKPAPARDAAAEGSLRSRLTEIDNRMAAIDRKLELAFPSLARLTGNAALSISETQQQLKADEALVLFLPTEHLDEEPEETFVWVVTKDASRILRSDMGTTGLAREVAALRCGLDAEAASRQPCQDLGIAPTADGALPFDIARAHRLYAALLQPAEDMIAGKHLLIVPSGALTQLPFQVLVTRAPAPGASGTTAYREAAWLVASHTITVLPAVSSLKALRANARASKAAKRLVGFGNPLLSGDPAQAEDAKAAKLAASRQSCRRSLGQRIAGLFAKRGGVRAIAQDGDLTDTATLRAQPPLPETADELCTIGNDLAVSAGDIHLGAGASETNLKRLSESGALAGFKIVHFATHGVLAGQLAPDSEPGLILTPPEAASATDDGYLTASEAAGLKLDADLVILSACNTAAGGASDAEALSGLARAFFYAGARALLVSHWAVYSDATSKLITATLREMTDGAGVGRAEALRRAMTRMIKSGTEQEAHPAYWAPFVIVGEGASVP